MELLQKVDVVQDISPEDFYKRYFKTQTPLVIKGMARNTFAGRWWSLDYFKDTMGDTVVDVYDNKKGNPSSANTTADMKMKLSDFINEISSSEKCDLRIFLYNMFKHNPQLKKEFPCPKLFEGLLDKIGHMFFGGKNTTVRIHYDIDMSNVMHTHFGGKKRVVLIAPEYSYLLYCLPLNTYSLIDPDKPDYKRYPGLALVKGYDFIIEPGDSVFIPAGYWHYMTYLEPGFSVSYRKMPVSISAKVAGFLNLFVYMPLDKMLNGIYGPKWLEVKKGIANNRADWMIKRAYEKERAEPMFSNQDRTWFI
ncbi:MAG: cupin-like domain-containing protein [Bacteroidia bacterium]